MTRNDLHKPTIEDAVELSGIEILHPGGTALTKRTAEIAGLKKGLKVLDISSARGTQSIYYAKYYDADIVGLDISKEMIKSATKKTKEAGLEHKIKYILGDSQSLPCSDNYFDVVINECAVGIPDDSQKVLNEMIRVVKPKGAIVIHESTWLKKFSNSEKDERSARYATTSQNFDEWMEMLKKAGATNIIYELEQWSKPEMFYQIREDRKVKDINSVMSIPETLRTMGRIFKKYGLKGIIKSYENRKIFKQLIVARELGYCLFKGDKLHI